MQIKQLKIWKTNVLMSPNKQKQIVQIQICLLLNHFTFFSEEGQGYPIVQKSTCLLLERIWTCIKNNIQLFQFEEPWGRDIRYSSVINYSVRKSCYMRGDLASKSCPWQSNQGWSRKESAETPLGTFFLAHLSPR